MIYVNHTDHLAGVSDEVKDVSISLTGLFQLQNTYIEK